MPLSTVPTTRARSDKALVHCVFKEATRTSPSPEPDSDCEASSRASSAAPEQAQPSTTPSTSRSTSSSSQTKRKQLSTAPTPFTSSTKRTRGRDGRFIRSDCECGECSSCLHVQEAIRLSASVDCVCGDCDSCVEVQTARIQSLYDHTSRECSFLFRSRQRCCFGHAIYFDSHFHRSFRCGYGACCRY